ncbi:MAG: hypothetical protein PHN88_05410 [Ignavibacteria bacterium]|nr:hypothetical protein [Ignavibacteria bacterium]
MSKIKALVVLLVVFGFFGAAFAKNFPGDRAGWKADYLYKKLKLTNEQYMKVYPAYLNYEMKVDDLKAKKMDKKGLETEMTKLQAGVNTEVEKILTKDQVTKWTPMKDKFYKLTPKKKVRKEKVEGDNKEVKKEDKKDKKDVKKEEKKDKKDVKKEDKKDKKEDKKDKKEVKKEEKKDKKDVKKEEPKKDEKKK